MRKIALLAAMLLACVAISFGQTRTVTGEVKDAQGNPVPFATVKVKGSKVAVAADQNGKFSVNIPEGAVLIVSGAGFQAHEINAGTQTTLSVDLKEQESLKEVVVTAMGQVKSKAKVGYSTATFNTENINKTAPLGPLDALQGKIAGADISTVSGTPGSSSKVVLRGYGVIAGGNNQPLYVIDGVPLADNRPASSGEVPINGARSASDGVYDYGNGLNYINPNDIESITVLKGTAASALYGSQAKNGSIIITTKRGKAGKLKVDLTSTYNLTSVGKTPDFQNEFGQGWDAVYIASENGSWGPRLDGKMRTWGAEINGKQQSKPFVGHDNIRDFYDVGTESNNTISLSGGNENNKFYFSYGNVFSDGIIPTKADYLERHSFAVRSSSTYKNFTLNTSMNYINRRMNAPATRAVSGVGSSLFEDLLQLPVDMSIKDFKNYKDPYNNVDNYFTPYAENPWYGVHENGSKQNTDRLFGNINLGYKFNDWLAAEFIIGGDFANSRTSAWNAKNAPSPGSYNAGGNVEGSERQADVGSYGEVSNYDGSFNTILNLKFNKDLSPKFTLEGLAGATYNQAQSKQVNTRIEGLTIPGFYNLSNSVNLPTGANQNSFRKLMGVYAQATLGYMNQLFLTVNARNDWSSTLPLDDNSFFYPGANLSWIASQTFDLSNTPISLLKFRAAYGKTGADAMPYQIYPVLGPGDVQLPYGNLTFPINGVGGYEIDNTINNQHLKPIITKEVEFGGEIRLFNNRFGIDADYYEKKTDGQIFTVPISPGSGYTGMVQNLGLVTNKGIEVTLDVTPVKTRDLTWTLNYTFARNRSNVENLNGGPDKVILQRAYDIEFDAIPGKPLGTFMAPVPMYTPDGQIVVNAVTGIPEVAPNKGEYGSSQRDFTMGLQNTISYKDFQLGFSFDYRKGGKFYSGTSDLLGFVGNSKVTTYNDRKPFIIPNSVNASVDGTGKTTYVENKTFIDEAHIDDYYYHTTNKAGVNDFLIVDRSFLKLRDVTLTYRLPQSIASKIKASNLSLTAYGRNFLMWTPKSNGYIDPEVTNYGNDLQSEFGEFRTGPSTKQFGLTLRASF
jgi:TonB-linked SusC/RagA family outer membrane protein